MTITVLLFAGYAEALGRRSLGLTLPDGATVADALRGVTAAVARSGALPARPLVAVNEQYASLDQMLRSGDEVAIIPPVAGG